MCGICGVYEFGMANPSVEARTITRMRDRMTHRGPDDAGVYISEDRRLGLGHRRLSIVDLSAAGRNPMTGEDGSVWITFNGEIYNHAALRSDLELRGHRYASRTDTETIVHLYEEKGLDFVNDLEGDFAIALWDSKRRRLILARDRIGVKPLYFTITSGRLVFASEIKSILAHPAISRDLDEEALYHYLTFLTTPAPRTLFRGISKLPAGQVLVCEQSGEIRLSRYWDAIDGPVDPIEDEEECAAEIRRLLSESIEKRMMSDVPFGVFLSGGVDSSANVALMSRLSTRPVRTFTVGYRDNPGYNEIEQARRTAREYETEHHEVMIGQQELLDFLPDLIFHQDEPIADPVCVPLYYVAKLARDNGTTVVQVGEGSDEIFCGYTDYVYYLALHDRIWRHLSALPRSLRGGLAAGGKLLHRLGITSLLPKGRKMLVDLLRRIHEGEELFWSGAFAFDEVNKRRLMSGDRLQTLEKQIGGRLNSHNVVREILTELEVSRPNADQLDRMIYLDLKLRLPELLLMRVDKITMAASVEARVPFLDHKLVEFAMKLPRSLKYRNGRTKHILKVALRGIVPDSVLEGRKQGFGAPINEWMLDRLGGFVEDSLLNSALRRRELFDYDFIERIISDQRAGRVNYSFFLWSLLNLSLWFDRWIEGSLEGDDGSVLRSFDDASEPVSAPGFVSGA